MKTPILAGLALASLLLIVALAPQGDSESVPDTKLGLSKTSVFDAPAPDATMKNQSEPGEGPLVERSFPEQPPVIPHALAEFLPITLSENQCAECHEVEEKIGGEPTPIPPSHYVDLRHAPNTTQSSIVGARYNCVSCHVSPGENPLLTGNMFGKY
jgi:cytochrome c-type protein NapB